MQTAVISGRAQTASTSCVQAHACGQSFDPSDSSDADGLTGLDPNVPVDSLTQVMVGRRGNARAMHAIVCTAPLSVALRSIVNDCSASMHGAAACMMSGCRSAGNAVNCGGNQSGAERASRPSASANTGQNTDP